MAAAMPPPGAQVSGIVVAHDSGSYLLDCVKDLLAQDSIAEVIVVDNGSRDGMPGRLPPQPRLRVLRNPDNPGFSVACNQGAALAQGAYVLFVNPDCRLAPDAVARLCAYLHAEPQIGLLGAALKNPDGSDQAAAIRRTPRPAHAIRTALKLPTPDIPAPPPLPGAAPALRLVEATSGALMLMRRDLFQHLGGFDEGYRLHCEDLDLCRRVLDHGLRIAVATDVPVLHHKGTSSRRRPFWVEWQKHRGMWRYFQKFDAAGSPLWLRLLVALGIAAHYPLAAVRAAWHSRSRR